MHIRLSPAWHRNRVKFAALRKAMANLDVMKSFFTYCASKDLGDYHPANEATNPFYDETANQKTANMKSSWVFISQFFSSTDWVTQYKGKYDWNTTWCKAYQIDELKQKTDGYEKGAIRIRIEANRFYDLFKMYVRRANPSQKALFEKTFYRQIAPLGIAVKSRQRVGETRRRAVDIYFGAVQAGFKKAFPTFALEAWPTEVTDERAELIKEMELKGDVFS